MATEEIVAKLLAGNQRFQEKGQVLSVSKPRLGLLIITCVDLRIPVLDVFDLEEGDATVIRIPGPTITVKEQADGTGIIRALAVLLLEHAIQRVVVLGHTDCAMGKVDVTALAQRLRDCSVPLAPEGLNESSKMQAWLGTFGNAYKNVLNVVEIVRTHRLLPHTNGEVQGMMYDVATGKVTLIETE